MKSLKQGIKKKTVWLTPAFPNLGDGWILLSSIIISGTHFRKCWDKRTRCYHSTSIQMVQYMGLIVHLKFFLNKQWVTNYTSLIYKESSQPHFEICSLLLSTWIMYA